MLELRGITAGYDTGTVLSRVDLVVPDGAVVALLGPNGAGKTTLLRVASGILHPSAGRILVDGHDLTGAATVEFARRGICHIPEGRGIFRTLTVAENLLLQSRPSEDGRERVADVFPRLGERTEQVSGTLSGGEQQMLALARSYVGSPTTVLLDEVSMGLAPKVVDQIFDYLHTLAARGTALLLVEQYVPRALELADIVFVLDRGRITFAGEPAELADETLIGSYFRTTA